MIINLLNHKINAMRELQRLESLKANRKQQELIDAQYNLQVMNIHRIVLVIELLNDDAKIEPDEHINKIILELLNDLKEAIESGLINKEKILLFEKKLKIVQTECRENWTNLFSELSNAKISTLKVVSGIDAEKVSLCLLDIQKAETWSTDVSVFKAMIRGLESADQLITNLGLNEEIISFLKNMNQGRATLNDLSDEVLNWIKKEKLQSKIRVSFIRVV